MGQYVPPWFSGPEKGLYLRMCRMRVKYIFAAHTVKGLLIDVEVVAHNFIDAKNKILMYIYKKQIGKHIPRGEREEDIVFLR